MTIIDEHEHDGGEAHSHEHDGPHEHEELTHDHPELEGLSAEELRDHNMAEMQKAIADLHVFNTSRIATIDKSKTDPWVELEFEMLSFKLDIIVDALAALVSPDKDFQMARFGMHFQLQLSQHLDQLMSSGDDAKEE